MSPEPSSRPPPARCLLATGALILALGGFGARPAGAALAERCSWPPPGGPAEHPHSTHVEVAPLVGDLDGDGIPEIVFLSFSDGLDDNAGQDGVLRILSGADCSEIASVQDVGCVTCFGDATCRSLEQVGDAGVFCPACTPAIADLDGDGFMEIVVLTETGDPGGFGRRAVILDHRGAFLSCTEATSEFIGPVAAIALADLEGDGMPEILARSVAWRASGELAWEHQLTGIGATIAADFDGDGVLEVTTGQAAYRADGEVMWANFLLRGGSPAIADLDLDCRPDLVVTSRNFQTINVVDPMTGAIRASAPIPAGDCPPRADGQGGPPTLADVDGDCVPEIGVAGCRRYALYKYLPGPPEQLVMLWEAEIDDASSRFTGSSIFDLDGDGTPEVLYNDQHALRIFDGLTGAVEAVFPNTTNTLLEFPVVADVDGDGHAEILLASNSYAACCDSGLRVLVDDTGPWAECRPLFNQHSYHVTNILDDGTLPAREEASWERFNTYRVQGPPLRDDVVGPRLLGVPGPATFGCGEPPEPATPSAEAGCGDDPVIAFSELRVDGPCPQSYELHRTWTATDRCGRTAAATQVLSTADEAPPALAVPPDVVVTCEEPPVPSVLATDACDPMPSVTMTREEFPGPCPLERLVLRTWEARDACGNVVTATQRVEIVDDGPPVLLGVPGDALVTCAEVPDVPELSAEDGCDPAPAIAFSEIVVPGRCPSERVILRTWEAIDACGHAVSATQRLEVADDGPPRLIGIPEDVEADCADVPPPADVRAEDGCDPAPVIAFTEERIDGPCPSTYRLVRRWVATDHCGGTAEAQQVIDVVDRTPPVVTGSPQQGCIWPPNHWMVCFGPEDFTPEISDDCPGEVTWRFVGCASDQPEDDLGDGHHAPDCVLHEDGTVCVRAERMGTRPEGRHYGLSIVATDACGNESAPHVIADIYVPHDQSPHEDCIKTTVEGTKNGPRRGLPR